MSKPGQPYSHMLALSPKEELGRVTAKCTRFIDYLRHRNDILFLTTSTRYAEHKDDIPKSTQLARRIKEHYPNKNIVLIDVPTLVIHTCEGNISTKKGNRCGTEEARTLQDHARLIPLEGCRLFRFRALGSDEQRLPKTL